MGGARPPDDGDRASTERLDPFLASFAAGSYAQDAGSDSGAHDAIVKWMTWRALFADECLVPGVDALRVAQANSAFRRSYADLQPWDESAVLRVLEARFVACGHANTERAAEAAEALLRIDEQRSVRTMRASESHSHAAFLQDGFQLSLAHTGALAPLTYADPVLLEVDALVKTTRLLIEDHRPICDLEFPAGHPTPDQQRFECDNENRLRLQYRLVAAALRRIAGVPVELSDPRTDAALVVTDEFVHAGDTAVDPEGFDEVVQWNTLSPQ